MDVAVDTSVLVTSWCLDSQKFEALFAYLRDTGSRLLLFEVVEIEFAAKYRETCQENMAKIESAVRGKEARRLRMQGIGKIPLGDSVINDSVRVWKKNLEERLSRLPVGRIPLEADSGVLREVVRQCANRQRPCSRKGEEFRDTLLWLGLLNYMEVAGASGPVALIAEDKTFAANDKTHALHSELEEDVRGRGLSLHYYHCLNEFLKRNGIMTDDLETGEEVGGYLRVDGYGGSKFALRNAYFSIEGSGDEGSVGAWQCMPCEPGARISLDSRFAGLSLGAGRARVHDTSYEQLYYAGEFESRERAGRTKQLRIPS